MFTPAQRNDDSWAREFEWLRTADSLEATPASVWDPDYEEEAAKLRTRRAEPVDAEAELGPNGHESARQTLDDLDLASHDADTVQDDDEIDERETPEEVLAPWSLTEMRPQVHVPDEIPLQVTDVWNLTEIRPQVHVPDEVPLRVTEVWNLPDIDPHVGVPDESNVLSEQKLFTAAWNQPVEPTLVEEDIVEPLPQVIPRVQDFDVLQSNASEARTTDESESVESNLERAKGLESPVKNNSLMNRVPDRSQSLARRSSWAAEYLSRLGESRVNDRLSLQTSIRVNVSAMGETNDAQSLVEEVSTHTASLNHGIDFDDEPVAQPANRCEETPQITSIDASQVLPDEDAFATEELNQVDQDLDDEETVVQASSRLSQSPRLKLIDESQVLPNEASFATAMSNPTRASRRYSPVMEFCAKTNMHPRTFWLAALLLVTIFAVFTIGALALTTDLFSTDQVNESTQSPPSAAAPISSTPLTPLTKDAEGGVDTTSVSKPAQDVGSLKVRGTAPASLGRAPESPPQTYIERPNLEAPWQASADRSKSEKPVRSKGQESRSNASRMAATLRGSNKQVVAPQKNSRSRERNALATKTSGAKKSTSSRRSEPPEKRRQAVSPAKDRAPIKTEIKTPSRAAGAQRPRTVTRQ